MAKFGQRENLYNVTTIIAGTDGKKVKWTVDKMDGGDVTAKETKYRPANGTVDQLSLGGATEVGNISLTVLMTEGMYGNLPWLLSQVGKADMWVNKQPLDTDGNAYGKALSYKGKLNKATPPKTDAESDAAGLLMLEQSSVTPVTTG